MTSLFSPNGFVLLGFLLGLWGCTQTSAKDKFLQMGAADITNKKVEGQDRGNGTDYVPAEDEGAWFADPNKTIVYCVDVSADFGLPREKVESIVEQSFGAWQTYVAEKQIRTDIPFARYRKAECSGVVDLTFYFGKEPVAGHVLSKGRRLGAAVRTSYDPKTGWGSGYIWIAPHGSVAP